MLVQEKGIFLKRELSGMQLLYVRYASHVGLDILQIDQEVQCEYRNRHL